MWKYWQKNQVRAYNRPFRSLYTPWFDAKKASTGAENKLPADAFSFLVTADTARKLGSAACQCVRAVKSKDQLFQLVHHFREGLQGRVDGIHRGHVHACLLQQIDGIVRTPSGQEADIAFHCGFSFL
jgi:hypothetical protein